MPVDFTRQTLDDALRGSDFDVNARSVVLWEGVTNYLPEAAVDATLRAIATSVSPGSDLLFTYVHHGLLDGSVEFDGGAEILERVRDVGEPWTCGFEPCEMPAYLVARGFALVEDLSAEDYAVFRRCRVVDEGLFVLSRCACSTCFVLYNLKSWKSKINLNSEL